MFVGQMNLKMRSDQKIFVDIKVMTVRGKKTFLL